MDEQNLDVDQLIEQKAKLEKLFKDQFTKPITVMFTDLKGSTSLAETQGDFAVRAMLKDHNEIVFPAVQKHGGTLVKSMGDGTMSHFPTVQDAVRAAAEIQKGMDAFNMQKKTPVPILMRIGINYGQGIVEKNDIFGDVVNVASRIEGQAGPGEVFLSQDAYDALKDKDEIYVGYVRETALKGKAAPMKLYKAYWNPTERDKKLAAAKPAEPAPARSGIPLAVKIAVPLLLALLAFAAFKWGGSSSGDETRTVSHTVSVEVPAK